MKAVIHSDTERAHILENVRGHNPEKAKALLQLSWGTGLRCAELAGLEIRDVIYSDNPKLIVRADTSKTSEAREIPLTQAALEAVRILADNRCSGFLILGRQDKPYSAHSLSERFKKLYGSVGIKGSTYSGRRGLATRLVDQGAPLPVVQRILGHKNLTSTMHYIGVTDSMVSKWMAVAA
ncbi:tyrosine-type recombinase/integrase [Sphingobium chungangianum]